MKIAVYIGKNDAKTGKRLAELLRSLEMGGCECYMVEDELASDTDMVLSVGGDGTFLSVSKLVADSGIPVVGVNSGRLGFLSENRPEDVAEALLSGDYTIEDRTLLCAVPIDGEECRGEDVFALNEITVHRSGAAVLGVDVSIDGKMLPTYWADGLIVSTSSGSTAYSLSVGGPIVLPKAEVLIISPIAPHNLNVRPIIVPDTSVIEISYDTRGDDAFLTADNRFYAFPKGEKITISKSGTPLNSISINNSFIEALNQKLLWGEDKRNMLK